MIMHVSTSAKIVEQEQNLPFQFFSTFDMENLTTLLGRAPLTPSLPRMYVYVLREVTQQPRTYIYILIQMRSPRVQLFE